MLRHGKNFHVTVGLVIFLFVLVMIAVASVAMSRQSNAYKIDTAQMTSLRKTVAEK